MDSRQQFEEWAISRGANPVLEGESYENVEDAYAWDIWQASRDSVMVKLPEENENGYITYTSAMRAIERQGITVK